MTTNILDLTKSLELNLTKASIFTIPKMETRLAIDKSGSMDDEFRNGWVQKAIDLFLAVAMKFDDNGKLDVGFYNNGFKEERPATIADIGKYVKAVGQYASGGTSFAPPLEAFKYKPTVVTSGGFFGIGGSSKDVQGLPVYLGFITDGVNDDQAAFKRQLDSLSEHNRTYVQIVAIGNGVDKRYLDSVANYTNVDVVYIPNPNSMTVDQFYELICNAELKAFIANLK